MAEVGYTKPLTLMCLSDRRGVIDEVLTFHLFIKVKAAMDQFLEGLECAGFLSYMKRYTDIVRPLFVDESPPLTASM